MEYTNSQIRDIIAEYIHNERDRRLLERRLIDGITFERLAEEFDLSVSQVKRIVWKGTEILSRHV
jgi:DNA-directed RNA polymerase specialized sigma subunit